MNVWPASLGSLCPVAEPDVSQALLSGRIGPGDAVGGEVDRTGEAPSPAVREGSPLREEVQLERNWGQSGTGRYLVCRVFSCTSPDGP